jgi:hypothetical protein
MTKKLIEPEFIKEFKELERLERDVRSEPTVRLQGTVVSAEYHIGKGIAILMQTPQGKRAVVLPGSCFLFEGKPYREASPSVVHREMAKTAEMMRRKAPFPMAIEAFESQVAIP